MSDKTSATTEPIQTIYLVDNLLNLHIQAGEQRLVIPPAGAQELLKFLERTQFTQNVNANKGAAS